MKKWWLIVVAICITILAATFDLARVSGASMSPALCDTDLVLTRRIWSGEELRGRIVLAKQKDGMIIKRVVAQGGDLVGIVRGASFRNGKQLPEPYLCDEDGNILINWPTNNSQGAPPEALIPPHQFFLLGDNRLISGDSRVNGPAEESSLRGVLVARLPQALQKHSCGCTREGNSQRIVQDGQ